MKKYLKRLNWFGFGVVMFTCAAGAAARTQDATLFQSFMVFLVLGLPLSTIFLFIGMEPKEK